MKPSETTRGSNSSKDRIDLFCLRAVKDGILTESQSAILGQIAPQGSTLDTFVKLVISWNVVQNKDVLEKIASDVASLPEGELSSHASETELTEAEVPTELDWFCYYAVQESVLTRDHCLFVETMVEAPVNCLRFAQALVATEIVDDIFKVQGLVDRAMREARKGHRPPESVFRDGDVTTE